MKTVLNILNTAKKSSRTTYIGLMVLVAFAAQEFGLLTDGQLDSVLLVAMVAIAFFAQDQIKPNGTNQDQTDQGKADYG